MNLLYCCYKRRATIYDKESGRAWWFDHGEWKRAPANDVYSGAAVLGKLGFDQQFGRLPPLPEKAWVGTSMMAVKTDRAG